MMGDYEEEMVDEPELVVAPPPSMPRQWSWNTETLLWVAGGVAGVGFIVWFVMSYTNAKSRFVKELNSDNTE